MFKPGDRVERRNGKAFSNDELVATVMGTGGDSVILKETGLKIATIDIKIVESLKRAEIREAIDSVCSHGIEIVDSCYPYRMGGIKFKSIDELLDHMFPDEDYKHKVQQLEQKVKDMSDEISQLRKKIYS